MNNYAGFSTKNPKAINTRLFGSDLVVEDLLNEIMTRKGERIMLPEFGCIVHNMLFEPMTDENVALVEADMIRIINNDPRAELVSIVVNDTDHSIGAQIRVNILPANEVAELSINIERN